MANKARITTGFIIVGAAGLGIKWWLDSQKPDAKLDDTREIRPVVTPTPQHREVTATGKDENGAVTSLHGDWGMVSKDEAISDIEADRTSYAVAGGQRLEVVAGPTGKYLRSVAGGGTANNLDELPSPEPVDPV